MNDERFRLAYDRIDEAAVAWTFSSPHNCFNGWRRDAARSNSTSNTHGRFVCRHTAVMANIGRKQIILQVVIKILNGSQLCAFRLMNNKVLADGVCNLLNMKSSLMKYRNWMEFCISNDSARPARPDANEEWVSKSYKKKLARMVEFPVCTEKGVIVIRRGNEFWGWKN